MARTIGVLAAALVLCAATGASSQAPETDRDREDIVSTATRTPRALYDTAAAGALLGRDEIRTRIQPSLLPEALVDVPSVTIQRTGAGQASPFIRGHTGFRTLLLLDGIRVNNSVFRSGPNPYWGTVDVLGVERLEVAKGPAGALYGSDAVGGVVQAFTGSPRTHGDGLGASSRAYYRYASADSSHQGRAETHVSWNDRLRLRIGVSPRTHGDLVAGPDVGRQPHTGYQELDGDVKAVYDLDRGRQLSALYQHVARDDVPRTHRTRFAVPFRGTDVGSERERRSDQSRDLAYLQYADRDGWSFADEARVSVSWQRMRESRKRVRSDGRTELSHFDVHTLGGFVEIVSNTALGTFVYGGDYYHDEVDSERTEISADGRTRARAIQGVVGDDARYDLLGVYARWTYPILDDLEIALGGRFTYAGAEANRVQDPVGGGVMAIHDRWYDGTGSASLLWAPLEVLRLYARVDRCLRAPNLSDLTRLDTVRSDEIQTPSPQLDPESFLGFELGAKTQGVRWRAGTAFYYTMIRDGLIRTPTGVTIDGDREVRVANVGDGYVTGIEAEGSIELIPNVDIFGHIAWQYGRQETLPTASPIVKSEYIDRLMPVNGLAGLRWSDESDRYWAEFSVRFAGDADRLSTRDANDTQQIPPGGTPGYAVLDLRGSARLTSYLTASLAIENIANRSYRVHGSGITSPGTNVIISGELTF